MQVEQGGYASDLLAARSDLLDTRDAGLAAEITLGVLRYQGQLDFLIEHYSRKAPDRLDREVRIALRMGIYQLRYLERVPPHAAVSETVELIKRARKSSAAGFANAVLRKVDRLPVKWTSRAVELSHPEWLLERWERQFGPEVAAGVAKASLRRPDTYIRVPPDAAIPPGLKLETTEIPGCFRVVAGEPSSFRVQDIGSQSIVPLLALEPGQSYLDICAAPGNKTAQVMEAGVRGVACDIHYRRLALLKSLAIDLVVLDASRPLPFRNQFDRILLDAPCTGTGTLAHNPEIKWRLQPADIERMAALQVRLLQEALTVLAPGGLLVYSTCSLGREENEGVIATVPAERVVETMRRTPGQQPGDGFFAAVIRS